MKHVDILIIDDEEKFAAMLSKRIELRGCTADVCHDGQTGLDWITENKGRAHLVLLDLQLPDIYGIQVLAAIKEQAPDLPVIIVTGHGTEKDRLACEELGAFQFIHKPLKIDTLMALFEQIRGTVQ